MKKESYISDILQIALQNQPISKDEALLLYEKASLTGLMHAAHNVRLNKTDGRYVGWIIDRNVNITLWIISFSIL